MNSGFFAIPAARTLLPGDGYARCRCRVKTQEIDDAVLFLRSKRTECYVYQEAYLFQNKVNGGRPGDFASVRNGYAFSWIISFTSSTASSPAERFRKFEHIYRDRQVRDLSFLFPVCPCGEESGEPCQL